MSEPGHGLRRAALLRGPSLCGAEAGSPPAGSNLDHVCAAVSASIWNCKCCRLFYVCDLYYSVYEGYPYLLAEMYAYSMAAAHDNLPHLQLENYMVSNTESSGEGWPLVDALEDACVSPDEGWSSLFYLHFQYSLFIIVSKQSDLFLTFYFMYLFCV